MELRIAGMSCGGCVKSVTKIISKHTQLESDNIKVDLNSGLARFESKENFDPADLLEALNKAGFDSTQNL